MHYVDSSTDHSVWRAFNNSGSVVMVCRRYHVQVTQEADYPGRQLWSNPGSNAWSRVRPSPEIDHRNQGVGLCPRYRLHPRRQDLSRFRIDHDAKETRRGGKEDPCRGQAGTPAAETSASTLGDLFVFGSSWIICSDSLGPVLPGSRWIIHA